MSRICQEIDQQVQAFLARPLESSSYAYVYLDATYLKGRLGKAQQVCSRAVVVAMGVNEDGRRELLGLKVGDSESETFLAEFISHLKERGLDGVKLVISDAHSGLTNAMSHERMLKTDAQLDAEIAALLRKAELIDAQEDTRYGKGKRGDELPVAQSASAKR